MIIIANSLNPAFTCAFPDGIEPRTVMSGITVSNKPYVDEYKRLMSIGDIASAKTYFTAHPELANAMITPALIQMLIDQGIALETIFSRDINDYIINVVHNKGDYSPTKQYVHYDFVFYTSNGATLCYLNDPYDPSVPTPIGTLPTNANYFRPLTWRGEKGESGTGLTPRGEYLAATKYYQYDCVGYNNALWFATATTTGTTPVDGGTTWIKFMSIPAEIYAHMNSYVLHIIDCTHSKSGTIHTLTPVDSIYQSMAFTDSTQVTLRFKATADFTYGDTFKFSPWSGSAVAPKTISGDSLYTGSFITSSIITCNVTSSAVFFKGGNGSCNTLPPQITNLTTAANNGNVALTWANPSTTSDDDFKGTVIVRQSNSIPSKVNDGIKVCDVSTSTVAYTDNTVTNGQNYYYRGFTYNSSKQFQTIFNYALAQPRNGQHISSLSVGNKVKMGTLDGSPIIWIVADKSYTDGFGTQMATVTLISEKILKLMCYDAKESSYPDATTGIQGYGNNNIGFSNIMNWANRSSIYSAAYPYDAPPTSGNGHPIANGYDSIQGFLNGFTDTEYDAMASTALSYTNYESAGSPMYSRIFLPSTTEIGITESSDLVNGELFSLFSSANSSRLAYPTTGAVSNNTATDYSSVLNTSTAWHWWTRTPSTSTSRTTLKTVCGNTESLTAGAIRNLEAYWSIVGFRPCVNIQNASFVSTTADANGYYSFI